MRVTSGEARVISVTGKCEISSVHVMFPLLGGICNASVSVFHLSCSIFWPNFWIRNWYLIPIVVLLLSSLLNIKSASRFVFKWNTIQRLLHLCIRAAVAVHDDTCLLVKLNCGEQKQRDECFLWAACTASIAHSSIILDELLACKHYLHSLAYTFHLAHAVLVYELLAHISMPHSTTMIPLAGGSFAFLLSNKFAF